MSNGARHALGFVVGLIATPVLLLGVSFGVDQVTRSLRSFSSPPMTERLFWSAAMIGLGALLGLLVASRLSPLASLIPGIFFAGYGLLWLQSPRLSFDLVEVLPNDAARGFHTVGATGIMLLLGALLLMASLPPSRWRTASRSAAQAPPPPLPARPNPQAAFGPPPAPGGQQHPFGPPPEQPRYGRQETPPPPGGQQYASPPPAGQQKPPAPGRRPDDGDDNPGEWTQMYGGNDR